MKIQEIFDGIQDKKRIIAEQKRVRRESLLIENEEYEKLERQIERSASALRAIEEAHDKKFPGQAEAIAANSEEVRNLEEQLQREAVGAVVKGKKVEIVRKARKMHPVLKVKFEANK